MPAIMQPTFENVKRALSDPNTALELVHLVARKGKKSKSKGRKKIKGGGIAGIVIGIIIAIIVICVILFLIRRQQKKKKLQQQIQPAQPATVQV